jgi:hypothetical protein
MSYGFSRGLEVFAHHRNRKLILRLGANATAFLLSIYHFYIFSVLLVGITAGPHIARRSTTHFAVHRVLLALHAAAFVAFTNHFPSSLPLHAISCASMLPWITPLQLWLRVPRSLDARSCASALVLFVAQQGSKLSLSPFRRSLPRKSHTPIPASSSIPPRPSPCSR